MQANTAPHCFGAELVKMQEDGEIEEVIDEEMTIGILGMLIGAGADAVSSVLQTFFKIMAMNPEAFRAAQEGMTLQLF